MRAVILDSRYNRDKAHRDIDAAPIGSVMTIKPPSRTPDQNAKLWAMLTDISRAMPGGRKHPAETWKELFCHACGWAVQFEMGLNGQPFPVGYRTSRMSKTQMADLITFIDAWAAEQGIQLSEAA